FRPAAQLRGQAAHARSDLDRVFRLRCAAHLRDAPRHTLVGQEILSERPGKMETMPSEHRTNGLDIAKVHLQLSFWPRTSTRRCFPIKNTVLLGCSTAASFPRTEPRTSAPPPG